MFRDVNIETTRQLMCISVWKLFSRFDHFTINHSATSLPAETTLLLLPLP